MTSKKQWQGWYGTKSTPEVLFNENWNEYQSNENYNKMYQAFKKCERAIKVAKEWGEDWIDEYIYDPTLTVVNRIQKIIKKVINKVRQVVRGEIFSSNSNIDWNGISPREGKQFYLIDLLDSFKEHVWSKIGTTERYTTARFNEHLTKSPNSYINNDIKYIKVLGIYDCGEIDPIEVESKVRTYLKKKYGLDNYIKNDRFIEPFDMNDLRAKIPMLIKKLQEIEM